MAAPRVTLSMAAGAWLVGMVIALPFVRWWARDIAQIPGPVWFWTGHHRASWRRGVAAAWILSGWPAIVVVAVWARSSEREELLSEAHDFYARSHNHSSSS